MSNTITITSNSTVSNQKEIELPAYFKDKITEHYVAIVKEHHHISVINGLSKMVSNYSWYPDLHEGKYVEITADVFHRAFNTCLQDITKEVACATA